jgi:hypothetical protein
MKFIRSVILPTFAALVLTTIGGAGEPRRMTGQGGFPLTDSVTSMWGAVDEIVSDSRPKPLTFLIYFVGSPEWHKGKWSLSAGMDKNPAFVEFTGPVVLRAEFDRGSQVLRVFGKDFHVTEFNVVLVQHVDDPERRQVTGIARLDLNVPAEANPAAYFVQQDARVRHAVFPDVK